MTLDTPDFTAVIAKPGDYIMRYANGELSAVSPEVFLAEFRPCGKPGKMDKEYLKEAAVVAIDAKLPDNHGFILLTAPYGEGENRRLTYISSMERATAISTVKEWLIKAGGEEEWMKHIK